MLESRADESKDTVAVHCLFHGSGITAKDERQIPWIPAFAGMTGKAGLNNSLLPLPPLVFEEYDLGRARQRPAAEDVGVALQSLDAPESAEKYVQLLE